MLLCWGTFRLCLLGRKSLWDKWIYKDAVKQQSFWNIDCPFDCSWNWRYLLKLRSLAKAYVKYVRWWVPTFLRYVNWHPWPLLDHFGRDFAQVSGVPLHDKVSSIIYNYLWTWPFSPAWQPPFLLILHFLMMWYESFPLPLFIVLLTDCSEISLSYSCMA